MTLRFPYQAEPLLGPPSPSLPPGAAVHWRPLLPVAIIGPTGLVRRFSRALLDPGSDDTIVPLDTVIRLQLQLLADTGCHARDATNSTRAQRYCVDGGFAQVNANTVTVLTDRAVKPEEINIEAARQALNGATLLTETPEDQQARLQAAERARAQLRMVVISGSFPDDPTIL